MGRKEGPVIRRKEGQRFHTAWGGIIIINDLILY